MTRPHRPQLTPEKRAVIRAALLSGKKPLQVCVEHGAAYATVVRIQREVRNESKYPRMTCITSSAKT